MTAKELEHREYVAAGVFNRIRDERVKFIKDKVTAFEAATEKEADSIYGERITAAQTSYKEAQKALTEELNRAALAGEGAKWPVGTVLSKWEWDGRTWSAKRNRVKTDITGVYEAVTSSTEFADNIGSWNRPKPGSFILRLHKKDGTTGKKFVKGWEMDNFFPEGETPKG